MIQKLQDGLTQRDYFRTLKLARKAHTISVKKELRVRDGIGCRWPGCEFWKQGYRVEGAHLEAAGAGGDKALVRTLRSKMIRICWQHHQGLASLHSGDLRVVPITDRGTDGPCSFERRDPKSATGWTPDGIEDDFTFTARRNPAAEETGDDC